MKKQQFLDNLFDSTAVFVDWDEQEYDVRDLMDKAYKNKHNEVRLTENPNQIEYFVELMSAVLGGGYLVRGKDMPKETPKGTYSSTTSGSTGVPKLISHNIENFIAPAIAQATIEVMDESSTFYQCLPTATNAVFSVGMLSGAVSGARVVFKKFNPYQVANDYMKYRPTHTTLVPGMYNMVRKTKEWNKVDLRQLRYFLGGANFMIPGFFDDIKSKGGRPVHGYGTTEIPAIMCAYSGSQDHLGHVWYPGAEWKAIDGELWCRWDHMDWWQSGDLVEVDPVHGPKLLGRKDNQFKYKDFKVVPESFELIAKELDTVNEAVLKLEDHLVMYYEGEATPSDIEDILKSRNICFMPKKIIKVDSLPKTALGKLSRNGAITV
jgi:acyl-CoA synthetase (AMP-forming)/AMP-acid ligase II